MTSVRLTFRLLPEQECSIDCVAEGDKGLTVSVDLRDSGGDAGHVAVAHRGEPLAREQYVVDPVDVRHGRDCVEEDAGRPDISDQREGGFGNQVVSGNSGILGHIYQSSQQVGQSKANPSSQTAVYQSYDGRSQVCKYQTYPAIKDDDEDAA